MRGERGPAWKSGLGIVILLMGLLLAVVHGNEWMKATVVGDMPFSVVEMPPPACEADELEEEGLSLEECRQMAVAVHSFDISSASWFPVLHSWISGVGLMLALLCLFAGLALVDNRRGGAGLALLTLAGLAVVDLSGFAAAVNSGPLIRQLYLWPLLTFFFIHMTLFIAVWVCRAEAPHTAARDDINP